MPGRRIVRSRTVRGAAAVWISLVALVLVAPVSAHAEAGLLVGVHEDQIKWRTRPNPILPAVRTLGLDAMRVTLRWRPGRRNASVRTHHELQRMVAADRHGVRIVLGVYGRADDAPATTRGARGLLPVRPEHPAPVQRDPGRRDLERGELRCLLAAPRKGAGGGLCGPALSLLGSPALDGAGDERGHDDGREPRSGRLSRRRCRGVSGERPVPAALRHRRAQPLSPLPGRGSRRAPPRLRRSRRSRTARVDARPVVRRHGTAADLDLVPRERLPDQRRRAWRRSLYAGHESVEGAVSGARQAEQLGAALRLAYCQPRVTAYFNFLLVDEPSLDRWQSGLLWADWRPKPSFAAYRAAIADVRAGAVTCAGGGGAGRPATPEELSTAVVRPAAERR